MERSMTLLNMTGDVAITWDEDQDATMRGFIERKMKEGYTFFVMERKFLLFGKRMKKVTDTNQLKSRKVWLDDEDLEIMHKDKKLNFVENKTKSYSEPVRVATSSSDVASNHTIAVRPMRGG